MRIVIATILFLFSVASSDAAPKRKIVSKGDPISTAMQFVGNTARQLGLPPALWCADFMNMIFGGSDRRAISYASRGRPAQHGCVGCVVVTKRKGGHHVGIVKGYDTRGNVITVSGNHGRKVGVGKYSKKSVVAYRYV
jgi:uncharacterized protein (TIGR02594 family)